MTTRFDGCFGLLACLGMLGAGCSAAGSEETDTDSLSSELRCGAAQLVTLPNICAADSVPVIPAALGAAGAPQIHAGETYGVHLIADMAGGKGGELSFVATRSGAYTFYIGTPFLPLQIQAQGSASPVTTNCVSAIDEDVCLPLRRAFAFSLVKGQHYRIVLGPITPERWVRLRIEAPGVRDRIVFGAALNGATHSDLFSIDPDGTNLTRLTNTATADEQFPRWSPDASRVAFMRDGALVVADSTGANDHVVTSTVGRDGVGLKAPAWSPDGARLAYSYPRPPFDIDDDGIIDESYRTTLHVIYADGTRDTPIPEPAHGFPPGIGTLTDPAWSSTGVIAFLEADDCPDCAGGANFATIHEDGSAYTQVIVDTFNQPAHDVDWSPDASRWAYTELNTGLIGASLPDGTHASEPTTTVSRMPRWSPDGTQLAFISTDGIYVINADGTGQRRIFAATDVRGIDW